MRYSDGQADGPSGTDTDHGKDGHEGRNQSQGGGRHEGTDGGGYLLANRQTEAGERFDAFAALFDPTTFRHLEGLGAGPGWRCWEVGAGGTSVVSWLAERVGPTGKVVATDIDTSLIAGAARPPVEVRVHDVGAEEPPGRASTSSTPGSSSSTCRTGNGHCGP